MQSSNCLLLLFWHTMVLIMVRNPLLQLQWPQLPRALVYLLQQLLLKLPQLLPKPPQLLLRLQQLLQWLLPNHLNLPLSCPSVSYLQNLLKLIILGILRPPTAKLDIMDLNQITRDIPNKAMLGMLKLNQRVMMNPNHLIIMYSPTMDKVKPLACQSF
ncbi:hypothetical protein BC833DRAFT_603478 [Globomyces pollinis-pini]|nr:hypothetical protein BC833DRAFT_603478 [Globomyces pollinis-pini]